MHAAAAIETIMQMTLFHLSWLTVATVLLYPYLLIIFIVWREMTMTGDRQSSPPMTSPCHAAEAADAATLPQTLHQQQMQMMVQPLMDDAYMILLLFVSACVAVWSGSRGSSRSTALCLHAA